MNDPTVEKGVSLIETLVALAVFSMVIIMVTGSFLSIISVYRHTQGERMLSNSLGYIFEEMVKDIMVGTNFTCDVPATPDGCAVVSFERLNLDAYGSSESISYGLVGDNVTRAVDGVSDVLNQDAVEITDLRVVLEDLTDGRPTHVRITLAGEGGSANATARARLQTTVVPIVDIEGSKPSPAAAGGDVHTPPACTYSSGGATTVVSFPGIKLASHYVDDANQQEVASLVSGTYSVRLVAWDGHDGRSSQQQMFEQYVVILSNSSGYTVESPPSTDLADGESAFFDGVVGSITVTEAVTHVTAHHPAYQNDDKHSLYPICAVFVKL